MLGELGNVFKNKLVEKFMNDAANIEVLYFNPGRIRVYARQIHHNAANAKRLVDYLRSVKEVKNFSVNPQTGSVLVEYLPEEVADNNFLRDLEELLRKKHERR